MSVVNETVYLINTTENNYDYFNEGDDGFYNPFEKPYFKGLFIFLYTFECVACLFGKFNLIFQTNYVRFLRILTSHTYFHHLTTFLSIIIKM